MSLWRRIKNIWFLSGISKEDIRANPHSFAMNHLNKTEMNGQAYIVGLTDEEQAFRDSLNVDNKDTLIT